MTTQAHVPDPMDGLHLAMMQRRREKLLARLSGRSFGGMEILMIAMLVCGIVVAVGGGTRTGSQVLRLGMGLLLIFEAAFLWWFGRRSARDQLRKLDRQIEAASRRPDAAIVAQAATAARAYLLRGRR
jgi:type VI protein secretion system component VasK